MPLPLLKALDTRTGAGSPLARTAHCEPDAASPGDSSWPGQVPAVLGQAIFVLAAARLHPSGFGVYGPELEGHAGGRGEATLRRWPVSCSWRLRRSC
jgi:hypothetical protein